MIGVLATVAPLVIVGFVFVVGSLLYFVFVYGRDEK